VVALLAHFQFLVVRDNVEPSPTGHLEKFIHNVSPKDPNACDRRMELPTSTVSVL
jgi:hypothetical protein